MFVLEYNLGTFNWMSSEFFMSTQGCGIAMPDLHIEPAGQVDFPG